MRCNASGEILSLTPSKLRTYCACPLRYKLESVDRLGGNGAGDSSAISFGNSLHAALEEIHRPASRADQPPDVERVLRRHWIAGGYKDEREEGVQFGRALDALRRYVEVMGRPAGMIFGTEVFLSRIVRLGETRVRLTCKVDKLELLPDGVLQALDYKSNAHGRVATAESLTTDMAAFIYYVLTRLCHPQHTRVVVTHLNVLTLASVTINYDDAALADNKRTLIKLVHDIKLGGFEPRPSSACTWCPVRDYCPEFGSSADLANLT